MSNVRRLSEYSTHADQRQAALSKLRQEEPSFHVAATNRTQPSASHSTRSPNPTTESEGFPRGALAEARQSPVHLEGQRGLSVPLRWRPAHGGCRSEEDTERQSLSNSNHVRFEQVKAQRVNASNKPTHSTASLSGAASEQCRMYGCSACRASNTARVPAAA